MSEAFNPLGRPIITGTHGRENRVQPKTQTQTQAAKSFQELLSERFTAESPGITFSKHAQQRSEQRGITLSNADMQRLSSAVGKARDKGLNDTLVLMDNNAFIVNIPSKVVVTVVDGGETQDAVFTNIDGAVIVK